jgi:hypothetical protein
MIGTYTYIANAGTYSTSNDTARSICDSLLVTKADSKHQMRQGDVHLAIPVALHDKHLQLQFGQALVEAPLFAQQIPIPLLMVIALQIEAISPQLARST